VITTTHEVTTAVQDVRTKQLGDISAFALAANGITAVGQDVRIEWLGRIFAFPLPLELAALAVGARTTSTVKKL
jgi:hypothetical protein